MVSQQSLVGSTDKQLKTTVSERLIPVHPTLIACGLLNFAEAKRATGQAKLFDDIDTGSTGSRPVAFSKWFTQFVRACRADKNRTSFHSFRADARARRDEARRLLAAGIDPSHQQTADAARARVEEHDTFKTVAKEWVAKNEREGMAEITLSKIHWLLDKAYPKSATGRSRRSQHRRC